MLKKFRRSVMYGVAFAVISAVSLNARSQDVLKYVNPNIGTAHSRWFYYTPAAVPGGMAKLAPSTNGYYGNNQGWEAIGYDTRQNSIAGFVHFHEWQLGGVSFMPTTGVLKVRPGGVDTPGTGYHSHFDRKNEIAEPGYYKVLLDDYHITAELTATKRVGFHRYTFPENDSAHIILDIGSVQGESGPVNDAGIKMVDDTHFEGYLDTYPKYVKIYDTGGKAKMFIYGEISKKPESVGAFNAKGVEYNTNSINGVGAGLFFNYKTKANEQIEIKVGLSLTSTENARLNLNTEASGLNFEQARAVAQQKWRNELSKLKVEGKDNVSKIKFYTGLFHALLGRGIASDVNGDYPKHGGTIGHLSLSPAGNRYNIMNTDAIWGGYWDLTQLWAMSYPEWFEDYLHTQMQIYHDRGWFADGVVNGEFVSGVGTNFNGLVFASAYQLGIRDYDVNEAYQAVLKNELEWRDRINGTGKMDLEGFLTNGYVALADKSDFGTDLAGSAFSASHTLEYSFSAFAAAQMAKNLGKTADYQKLIKISNYWRNLFNPANKLIQPKNAKGEFIDKFDPYQPWRGFQEGNAMQYAYYVPQNPAALIAAQGKAYFNSNLDDIFEKSEKDAFGGGKTINAFAGVSSVYNHGNEPSLHISWLFNFSGKPWLTQKWTRSICDKFYGTEPIHGYGYGQDEDQGQLGTWYVLASLGLFDVKGFTDAKPIVELGSPVFDKAAISLGNGRKLIIETKNNSKKNVYVQSVTLHGKHLYNCWLYRDELMKGGRLTFYMGEKPNKNWGVKNLPPSFQ